MLGTRGNVLGKVLGMALEKIAEERQDFRARVLEHVVPRIREPMHFGVGKEFLPLSEEMVIEDEIPLAP